jgi:hypothetical protein
MHITLKNATTLSTFICVMSACATHPDHIPPSYTSPMQYQSYSCKQIGAEMQVVSTRVSELYGLQEKAATNSDVEMGVGLVLLWPVLFMLDSNSAQAAEYARLKGEFDALEKEGIQKKCGLHVERPKETVPQTKTDESEYPAQNARH